MSPIARQAAKQLGAGRATRLVLGDGGVVNGARVRGPGRSDEGPAGCAAGDGQHPPQALRDEGHERVCERQQRPEAVHQHLFRARADSGCLPTSDYLSLLAS